MKALTQDSTGAFPGSIAAEMMFVYVFFWADSFRHIPAAMRVLCLPMG